MGAIAVGLGGRGERRKAQKGSRILTARISRGIISALIGCTYCGQQQIVESGLEVGLEWAGGSMVMAHSIDPDHWGGWM